MGSVSGHPLFSSRAGHDRRRRDDVDLGGGRGGCGFVRVVAIDCRHRDGVNMLGGGLCRRVGLGVGVRIGLRGPGLAYNVATGSSSWGLTLFRYTSDV